MDLRLESDKDAKASGIIVNTAGWIADLGFHLLIHAIQVGQVAPQAYIHSPTTLGVFRVLSSGVESDPATRHPDRRP